MTDDQVPDGTPGLIRSLDAVVPPDQWDDIVLRARVPEAGVSGEHGAAVPAGVGDRRADRTSRIIVAAAAAVMVVAGLAVGLAVSGRDATPAAGPAMDDPAGIWGHSWQLTRIEAGDGVATDELADGESGPVRLDLRSEGRVSVRACNTFEGALELDGDLLRMGSMTTTAVGCGDPIDTLVSTLLDAPARVDLRGSTLVLRSIPPPATDGAGAEAKHPLLVATFVRTDALSAAQQFWGQSWRVTSVADRTGTPKVRPSQEAPLIDTTATGRIQLSTCGHPSLRAAIDGDRLVPGGPWADSQPNHGYCLEAPSDDVIRAVFRSQDATVAVKGRAVTVTAHEGVVRAVLAPTSFASELFGHEWVIVRALDHDEDQRVPGDFHLTARRDPKQVTVPGCLPDVGGPASMDGSTLTVVVLPPSGRGDCSDALGPNTGWLTLADWFREFFAAPLSVTVIGQRASIEREGMTVVLLRVD
jgi:heat shock protein HslJ